MGSHAYFHLNEILGRKRIENEHKKEIKKWKFSRILAGPKIRLYAIHSSNFKYTEFRHANQIPNINVRTSTNNHLIPPTSSMRYVACKYFLIEYMGFVWNALHWNELVDEMLNIVWLLTIHKIQVYLCVSNSDLFPSFISLPMLDKHGCFICVSVVRW